MFCYYNAHAILVFSTELLVACSSVFEDCSCISCWALCELLQYFLPNMIVGNIVKMGGHHKGHNPCPFGFFLSKARKKNVLVLVIGRVDFHANKKKCGPQNKYNTEKNTESRIFFTCQSAESTFICILSCFMNVLSTGLNWISSFKTF